MKTADGYLCSEEEINGYFFSLEPDMRTYAGCLDCPAHWRGDNDEQDAAVRYRVDEHIRATGHRVSWRDVETTFYDRDPLVIGVKA